MPKFCLLLVIKFFRAEIQDVVVDAEQTLFFVSYPTRKFTPVLCSPVQLQNIDITCADSNCVVNMLRPNSVKQALKVSNPTVIHAVDSKKPVICITGNRNVSLWECIPLPGMGMCLSGSAYPCREWECVSLGVHTLAGNGNVSLWACIPLPGMGMCLSGSAYPCREWECVSLGVHTLAGNGNVLLWECIPLPGMHTIYIG